MGIKIDDGEDHSKISYLFDVIQDFFSSPKEKKKVGLCPPRHTNMDSPAL
jgi:hypothetical protein